MRTIDDTDDRRSGAPALSAPVTLAKRIQKSSAPHEPSARVRQKAKSHAAKLKKALAAIGCEASGGDEDRGDVKSAAMRSGRDDVEEWTR